MSAPNLKTVQGVLLTQANTSDRHHEVHLVLQTHAVENETEGCGDNGDGHCWQSELGFTNASITNGLWFFDVSIHNASNQQILMSVLVVAFVHQNNRSSCSKRPVLFQERAIKAKW